MKARMLAAITLLLMVWVPALAGTDTLATRLGYPADAKLLIIHGDDLGVAHSVNDASTKALEIGLVNSASIMVPCPWFPEIAAWARAHPDADLGLHLTLTSEWKGLRWGSVLPRTQVKTLYDSSGYLYPTETDAAQHMNPREAEAEIRAQIARAKAMGIKPTHLDSHMGTLYQNRALFEVLLRVARDEKLPARISRAHAEAPFRAPVLRPSDIVIDRIISIEPDVTPEKWADYYANEIRNLQPGVTEIVIHLAHDDAEMRAVSADHPDWGAAWRQRDFDFFTSDALRALLRENNVRLVTWRELGTLVK